MPKKYRKQRVSLRFKRKEQLKHRVRYVVLRSVVAALVIGFGAGLVTSGDSFVSRFMHGHNPSIDVRYPKPLEGLPILTELPRNAFWMWFPGSGVWLEKRVCRKYLAVRAIHLERHFDKNQIVVRLEPRLPLVSWSGQGLDKDGVLFALTPGTWNALPDVSFLAATNKQDLSRWLARLSAMPELWPEVSAIRQTPSETLELTLKTGTVVIWGPLETETVSRKGQMLARVLDDAHKNMGGAARADLRFFDQGRIIVLPKAARQ